MTRKGLTLSLVTAALLLAATTAAQAGDWRSYRAGQLRVVTQNLYVGGDILLPLSAETPAEFQAAAAMVIEQILATNYPERAIRLSDQFLHEWPHLIGLQEVYIVKVCSDLEQTRCLINQDYLEILLENLNQGVDWYREVATITNIDLQNLPAVLPNGDPVFVSITDRDVTLAHRFVRTGDTYAANYAAALPVDSDFLPEGFAVLRGYTTVEARIWDRDYLFANTHLEVKGGGSPLEPFFRAVQYYQALELTQVLMMSGLTQIVVGDFNSDPFEDPAPLCLVPDGQGGAQQVPGCTTPYAILSIGGLSGIPYTDIWLERRGPFELGNTCCQAALLDNVYSQLYERVDLIWARQAAEYAGPPFLRSVRAKVIGEEPGDKTYPSGLWPSDHAGVSAKMIVFTPK